MRLASALIILGSIITGSAALAQSPMGTSEISGDKVVVEHNGVSITHAEFEAVLASSPEKVKRLAAKDLGDRFELINSLMVVRKLAAEAEELESSDPAYWDLYFEILGVREQYMFRRQLGDVKTPQVEALAREYYKTRKDHYAKVPEARGSSHILLASRPGLDRKEVRAKAQAILEELRAGGDWDTLVVEHSDDPSAASRKGALRDYIELGDSSISPPYSGALFDIQEVGEFSEVTDTQFGVHIIRLDGIRASSYKEYDDVRDKIIGDILTELRTLASKEIRARYNLDEGAFIDGPAMDELFAPYK